MCNNRVMATNKVYLVGSLRNPRVPEIAHSLRNVGFDVYDDWYAVGPKADDHWKEYEQVRGRTYSQALQGWHAKHVFEMDMQHLKEANGVILVRPAGKSGHMEFGWAVRNGAWGVILLEEGADERWDIMGLFADHVVPNVTALLATVEQYKNG